MLLFERFFKQDLLDNYLITFFEVRNVGKKSAMRVILFYKKFLKFNEDFKNVEKNEKKFFVSEIILSELVALSCIY